MKKLIITLGILIILASSVFGFGVTDWLTGPINVPPGGSSEVVFELQNMLGNEDMIAKAQIKQGSDIVTIKEGDEIDVPFGVKKEIHALINIPENYSDGTYPVTIEFLSIAEQGKGPVQFNTGVTKNFNVVVGNNLPVSEIPKEEKTGFGKIGITTVLILLAILIIIIAIVKFIHKKR